MGHGASCAVGTNVVGSTIGGGHGCESFHRNRRALRFLLSVALALAPLSSSALADGSQKGALFSLDFSGSGNRPGEVFKLDPSAGYRFSNHLELNAGLPVYFVHASDTGVAQGFSSKNGIGNAYLDLRYFVSRSGLLFSSTATGTAPTGNKDDGFSTGRVTFDWSNYIEKGIGRFTPYGNVGIANTISDTNFFNRPFTTLGIVGHFEGGTYFELWKNISLAASAYAITPTGEQKIYSKFKPKSSASSNAGISTGPSKSNGKGRVFQEASITTTDASILADHGYTGWIDFRPSSIVKMQFGYSRSVSYALNTIFFWIGFDIKALHNSLHH